MKKESGGLYGVKNSGIHGKGIFARTNIKKGIKIIEYIGEKISKKEGDKRSEEQYEKAMKTGKGAVYVFELNKTQDLDGDVPWNPARFINHSCNPNCKVSIRKDRIWIFSIKNIKKGQELSYDYGYDLEDYHEHPCKCGSKNCMGYIIGEENRKKFEKLLEKFSGKK